MKSRRIFDTAMRQRSMAWRIELLPVAEKELAKLDRPAAQRILVFVDQRIRAASDPRAVGEALVGKELGQFRKYRIDDYRLICSITDHRVLVTVVRRCASNRASKRGLSRQVNPCT